MANQNQTQTNDFIAALADAVNKTQKPTREQLQEEKDLNTKAKKAKTTMALSLSAGLIGSAGFALKGIAAGTFALGPVIGIGAGIAAGTCILLAVIPAIVRWIKNKRAAKKAQRNAQIANKKMFFERVGYIFGDKPKKGNILKRIGLGIAGIFNKEIREDNKQRKAKQKEAKETYEFEKNLLYKEPWSFVNINSALINSQNDPTMEQLVMIKETPEIIKDEKGVEKKYYRVASVYENDKGQKVSFISEEQLLAINPKTGKLNCSPVEMSANELNQRIANGYFQQQADILPAAEAVNLRGQAGQQTPTQQQAPTGSATSSEIDNKIAAIRKQITDLTDQSINNPAVNNTNQITQLQNELNSLISQKHAANPQIAQAVQQAQGLTVAKAQTGAAAPAATQTQKLDLDNPTPVAAAAAPAAAPTPKEQSSIILSLFAIIIPPLANWLTQNPEKAAELSKESSNSLVVINLAQKLLEQYQNSNVKDVPVTEETVKEAVKATAADSATTSQEPKEKKAKAKSGKNSHK